MKLAVWVCGMLLCACANRNKRDYLPQEVVPARTVKEVLEDSTCSPQQASYHKCVRPIIIARCYGCHTDTARHKDRNEYVFLNKFLVLQSYAQESYSGKTEKKIQTHIKALDPFVFRPMPFKKIPDEEIALIDAWIARGALED